LEHAPKSGVNTRTARVAAAPVPDKHDPARAVREDYENVLAEAGHWRAVALLRAAGRGPRCYVVDRGRERRTL
jgi:hypothetical protein